MADFTDEADDTDASFRPMCIMISAATLLNLYDELPECCTKRKLNSVGEFAYVFVSRVRLFEESLY